MPSWNSRLQVSVGGVLLSPITTFTTVFQTSTTAIHSIESDNVGVIGKPQTMTFTMTIPAILDPTATTPVDTAATLYKLAIAGTPFDVAVTVFSGNDWVFKSLTYRGCFITSASPSNVTVGTTSGLLDTTPVATFSGIVTDFVSDTDVVTP